MDRISTIVGYEWRAYWRRFSRAGLRAGNQGILLILTVLIAIKYFQFLLLTSARVERGDTTSLTALLGLVFLAWLFPLGANTRHTTASHKWLHLPLSLIERFLLRASSLLIPPTAWIVVVGSLAIVYPLAHANNPVLGVVAGLLFILLAWLMGLTVMNLLNSLHWRTTLGIAALVIVAITSMYVIREGVSAKPLTRFISPAVLVVRAATARASNQSVLTPGISVVALALLTLTAGCLALWSFKRSLYATPAGAGAKVMLLSSRVFPGRLGGLISKDLKYFCRLLDIYLGVAVAMLGCLYLVVSIEPSASILWSFIVVVFLCNSAVVFNSFGLDSPPGLDRYTLLPLSGKSIVFSKNLAYLMIISLQVIPVLVLGGWRLGILSSLAGLIETLVLAFAYLTWGNWMSVHHPLKTQFFRFANSGAALVDSMGGLIFGSVPGIALIYLWQGQGIRPAAGTILVFLLTAVLYLASVTRFGAHFSRDRERIAESLL